jgi:hypothetical protein
MFEKLLSLLLQAKSGAVATVFVIGASGALVTATVNDGVATITVTPNENSTETTTDPTTTNSVEQAILALFNRTESDESTAPATSGPGCSDEAHERNEHMKRVNAASQTNGEAVRDLAKDARGEDGAKELVKDADTEIRDIRQLAVKAIHGTFDCDPNEDEDNGEDEDGTDDEDGTSTESSATSTTTTTVTLADFTGDAEAIADLAIDLMEQVVEKLETDLEGLEDSDDEETTTANTTQNGKSEDKGNKGKGNGGNGKGRNR